MSDPFRQEQFLTVIDRDEALRRFRAHPRGATAVVSGAPTDVRGGRLVPTRPAAPGAHVTFAGTDIGRGETVLFRGTLLTSRETGVLAALGIDRVAVVRRPRVGIIST